jgi:hypothetical protein
MMRNLAQTALNHSLKVSYLDEQKEYAPMADLLDDVYLQLPRKNLQFRQFIYRSAVSTEYDSMCSVIDLMDERLKTVRIVCNSRRRRNSSRRVQKKNKKNNIKTQPKDEEYYQYLAFKYGCYDPINNTVDGKPIMPIRTPTSAPVIPDGEDEGVFCNGRRLELSDLEEGEEISIYSYEDTGYFHEDPEPYQEEDDDDGNSVYVYDQYRDDL